MSNECISSRTSKRDYLTDERRQQLRERNEYIRLGVCVAVLVGLSTLLIEYTHSRNFHALVNRTFSNEAGHKGYLTLLNATVCGGGYLVVQQLKKKEFFGLRERIKKIFEPTVHHPNPALTKASGIQISITGL